MKQEILIVVSTFFVGFKCVQEKTHQIYYAPVGLSDCDSMTSKLKFSSNNNKDISRSNDAVR
jgi:hypothetical protein